MKNHIPPHDNNNQAIVGENHPLMPLCYFNRLLLNNGQEYNYQLKDYESVIVLASGSAKVNVDGQDFGEMKRKSIWEEKADSVYAPLGAHVTVTGLADTTELFVAGGKIDKKYESFRVAQGDVEQIQYGSDDTKTHRRINHILGKNADDKTGRLLVSELFTVGKGGWSGFPPHKHDTDRLPDETRFEEVYQFRFRPEKGFAAQFLYQDKMDGSPVYNVQHGSTFLIDRGYHPVVVAPGYEMYYFTIIVGENHRSLVQFFEPLHAEQVNTIPGIANMIAGFK